MTIKELKQQLEWFDENLEVEVESTFGTKFPNFEPFYSRNPTQFLQFA